MLTRSRRAIVVAAVVVLALVALASRAFLAKDGTLARYRTEAVSRGAIVADVTATGTVNPVSTVQVGTYVSGPIQAIYADFNSHVTKGQLVAKIDPRQFELRVEQADAALANARAKLEKSRADLRYKTLTSRATRSSAPRGSSPRTRSTRTRAASIRRAPTSRSRRPRSARTRRRSPRRA